jgi:uncharacterized protein
MKNALIIFIRNPQLGKVKTRLAKTLGAEKTLKIYLHLLEHTQNISRNANCDAHLYYSDFIDDTDDWDKNIYQKHLQIKGDLGEKMSAAFKEQFDQGYQKVAIIGSDCLELKTEIIDQAFRTIQENQAVIGPTLDGGYYLLGMSTYLPYLFQNKKWSTNTVFMDTLNDLEKNKVESRLLDVLNDIDEEKDLPSSLRNYDTI